jgi:hypothetical protein
VAPGPSDLNSTLQEIISKVTESDLTDYITDLQNFGSRFAYTQNAIFLVNTFMMSSQAIPHSQ